MDTEKFKKYAELKKQIEILDTEIERIKPEVTAELEKIEGNKFEDASLGQFYFMTRKSWTYPAEIKSLEESVKKAKKEAEEAKTATFTESKSLVFKTY